MPNRHVGVDVDPPLVIIGSVGPHGEPRATSVAVAEDMARTAERLADALPHHGPIERVVFLEGRGGSQSVLAACLRDRIDTPVELLANGSVDWRSGDLMVRRMKMAGCFVRKYMRRALALAVASRDGSAWVRRPLR